MNTTRRILSSINRCRKSVWRSVKNNCLLSWCRRRTSKRDRNTSTIQVFDDVAAVYDRIVTEISSADSTNTSERNLSTPAPSSNNKEKPRVAIDVCENSRYDTVDPTAVQAHAEGKPKKVLSLSVSKNCETKPDALAKFKRLQSSRSVVDSTAVQPRAEGKPKKVLSLSVSKKNCETKPDTLAKFRRLQSSRSVVDSTAVQPRAEGKPKKVLSLSVSKTSETKPDALTTFTRLQSPRSVVDSTTVQPHAEGKPNRVRSLSVLKNCETKPGRLAKWDRTTTSSDPLPRNTLEVTVDTDNDISKPQQDACSETKTLDVVKFPNGCDNRNTRKTGQPYNSVQFNEQDKSIENAHLAKDDEIELKTTDKAWVPVTAAKEVTAAACTSIDGVATNLEFEATEELNKNVREILHKITPDNVDEMIESFKALPIDTIERLENAVELVYERAIQEQNFAQLYASLSSAVESVKATCAKNEETMTFGMLIVKKCQNAFESDKARRQSSDKFSDTVSCIDLENKKELRLEDEKEEYSRKRAVGNCRFIGELFKKSLVQSYYMRYFIVNLIGQRSDETIECLYTLLRTAGKELDQSCNLNDIFDKLESLTSVTSIGSRASFMIRDIVDLRTNEWSPRILNCVPEDRRESDFGADDDHTNCQDNCESRNVSIKHQRHAVDEFNLRGYKRVPKENTNDRFSTRNPPNVRLLHDNCDLIHIHGLRKRLFKTFDGFANILANVISPPVFEAVKKAQIKIKEYDHQENKYDISDLNTMYSAIKEESKNEKLRNKNDKTNIAIRKMFQSNLIECYKLAMTTIEVCSKTLKAGIYNPVQCKMKNLVQIVSGLSSITGKYIYGELFVEKKEESFDLVERCKTVKKMLEGNGYEDSEYKDPNTIYNNALNNLFNKSLIKKENKLHSIYFRAKPKLGTRYAREWSQN